MKPFLLLFCCLVGIQAHPQEDLSVTDSAMLESLKSEVKEYVEARSEMLSQEPFEHESELLDDNLYMTRSKIPGWYCLGGIGYSVAGINQERTETQFFPLGFNVASALGYFAAGGYSIELGSYIDVLDFSSIRASEFRWAQVDEDLQSGKGEDFINWSTTFYLGVKARIPNVRATNWWNPSLKVFIGRGVSVIFWEKERENGQMESNRRVHLEGFSYGLSFSNVLNIFSDKNPWYWEVTFSRQMNTEYFFVEDDGALPAPIANDFIRDQTLGYVLRFTVGTRLF